MLSMLWKFIAHGKARFACAALGVAAACGAIVFMFSLTATNAAQAPALAARAAAPWVAWQFDSKGGDVRLDVVHCTIDYRPGGRVLQGPPMRAVIAAMPKEIPYSCTSLKEGRLPDDAAGGFEVVLTRSTLRRFARGNPPPIGSAIKFVGRVGTMTAKIVGYLDDAKLPFGWPGVFANKQAFAALKAERQGTLSLWRNLPHGGKDVLTANSEKVVAWFRGDEQKRMDYARPLLLIAAVLTALCLLVNSLLLSVEANRREIATLRTIGMSRGGVMMLVTAESFLATLTGFILGCVVAIPALVVYVAFDAAAFPTGATIAWNVVGIAGLLAAVVACTAVLFALKPALSVRPLDSHSVEPRRKRLNGMAIAFACGFGAFVAVEVWGASLMRGFVPSAEWPDAIVSILPEGVSSFEIEKLRSLPGVSRVSELVPLQLNFSPEEEMKTMMRGARKSCRNALFLAAEWLPKFKFVEGTWDDVQSEIFGGDGCVISEMISRSRNLHRGDKLKVVLPGRGPKQTTELPVVGVVDVNWHMVTSRGLVRGMNGAPVMTDGPVFVSFDTMESLDARPAAMTKMTHLWVEYEPKFLKEKGVFPAGRAVEASIAKVLSQDSSTVRLHARDEIADGTLAHGSDLIGQAARVPFVFLAILSLGFIAMLVAEADAQKRSFAVLRAVGATRLQLTLRLVLRAMKIAVCGILFGFPIGALSGWLAASKTAAIWPGMPNYFDVPCAVIAEGTIGALLFVLVIAVPTAMILISRAIRGGMGR